MDRLPLGRWLLALAVLTAAALWWRSRGDDPAPIDRAQLARPAKLPRVAIATPRAADLRPRAADEWQGMLINPEASPPCETSAGCGLGRACKAGRCTACAADADCADGEACALDHCVVRALAACRTRTDCGAGQLCVLSGYSSLARGNEDMRAYCLDPASGAGSLPPAPEVVADPRTHLPDDDLIARARAAR
jgi:hypothetical protein